jgi:ribonuclease R
LSKPSDSAILKHIQRQSKQTASFKQLVRELGVHGDARRELSNRLEHLVNSAKLLRIGSDRFAIPQPKSGKNMLVGRLTMHRDGYGFVIPQPESLPEALKNMLSGDVFIPPPAIGSAMHGDRVLVEVGAIRPDGRAEGRVIRIVGRAHPSVVGTFHYGNRYNYVHPMDEKITQDIVIPSGEEFPREPTSRSPTAPDGGKRHTTAHRVLGQ